MKERDVVVLAHNIRSLWNIGSLFRSADAFKIRHIYLTGYTAIPPRTEIHKTALGAEEWVLWSKHSDATLVISDLKSKGYTVVSLEISNESTPLHTHRPPEKTCIILGHEILGVTDQLQKLSDAVVHIPMLGKKDSLNVSVAAGIAFYHYRCAV